MANNTESNYRQNLSAERTKFRWVSDHGDRMFHRHRETPTNPRANSTEKKPETLASKKTRWPF
jgi:hypothetical protein